MKNFLLNQNNGLTIELFSKYHLLLIFTTLLIIGLIINNKERFINMDYKNKRFLQIGLSSIILINFLIRRGSFIYFDVYDWHRHLDINFCNFNSILFFIYGLTGNKNIYNICFYFAFIGPLTAILIPSVNISPLNYSFYSFIILHHLVFIFNIMFMYIENKKHSQIELRNVLVFLTIYHLTIYTFNCFFGTNYNETMTFINDSLNNMVLIRILLSNYFLTLGLHIVVEILLLTFAKYILKFLNSKS